MAKPKYEVGETFDKLDNKKSKRRNRIWRENNRAITRAYIAFYAANSAEPTLSEIAEQTGLSKTTVHAHFAHMEVGNIFEDTKKEFAAFLPDILMAIMQSAMKGNSRSQELFLRAVADWTPEQKVTGDLKLENGLAEALLAIKDDPENADAE